MFFVAYVNVTLCVVTYVSYYVNVILCCYIICLCYIMSLWGMLMLHYDVVGDVNVTL